VVRGHGLPPGGRTLAVVRVGRKGRFRARSGADRHHWPMSDPGRRPFVLAHRGDHTRARENTVAAFQAATAVGADGVELDVRRTADGTLVVHHDAEVDGVGVLAHVTFAEVRHVVPWLPTLDEALAACSGMALVNVEIKNLPHEPDFDPDEQVARAVVGRVYALGLVEQVVISSFVLPSLERVHELDRHIATAWLTLPDLDPLAALDIAAARGCAGIHPAHRAMQRADVLGIVARAEELGLVVRPWTVDDEREITRLGRARVHGIITDRPAMARRALGNDERE